jgi:hypothetical protein
MISSLLLALAISTSPSVESSLAGKWGGEGEVFFDLRAGGKGKMEEESISWSIEGDKLKISDSDGGVQEIRFKLKGDRLTISIDDTDLVLHRVKGAASAPPQKDVDQLSGVLVSAAWCTKTSRVSFLADGSWTMTGDNEKAWTGRTRTAAQQNAAGSTGRWAVKKNQLHMSMPPEAPELQPIRLQMTQTAEGKPQLRVNGVEYSTCP